MRCLISIADCGLRIADRRLPIVDCRLSIAARLDAVEEPVPERVRRLDADHQRHRRDRQRAEVAGREPHRVLFGGQHEH
jgi:hypothetical protein